MPEITDIHKLRKLQERYPFNEEELEILVLCHEHLKDGQDDFLMSLAKATPYSFFFLPGDELRDRVNWIEDYLLPAGFSNELRAAISLDPFVTYANQGEDAALERLLEGVADTGRRGSKEALRLLYRLIDQPEPEEIMDICIRLAIASEALVTPNLDKEITIKKLEDLEPASGALAQSLLNECGDETLTEQVFVRWAEEFFPLLSAPLSTFVHGLLFHGRPYPHERIPFSVPKLDTASNIFTSPSNSPSLMALSMVSNHFGGKWHRIYSSFMDGRSFNRLEWSLLGYSGPTVLFVKTTARAVLGAFTASTWKESQEFYGNADCFLFELEPNLMVHRPLGTAEGTNFMYLHTKESETDPVLHRGRPCGIGFGGSLDQPRFFIPESFDSCSAAFFDDKTFHQGELLPIDSLEKFEIQQLEVWGVGGDETIVKALRERAEYRERSDTAILRARKIQDKSSFAEDFKSGLIPNKSFSHQKDARGRPDFRVDDEHGGYKVDRA